MPFPTLEAEERTTQLQFALVLRDGFSDSDSLLGDVSVTCANIAGQRKGDSSAFLFYALPPGAQVLNVSPDADTPYYVPRQVTVTVPVPQPASPAPQFLWVAFPDIRLADQTKPLRDPAQSALYKAQRDAVTLLPSTQYPFPGAATLVRGTVTHLGAKLKGATVSGAGQDYATGDDGQFVLFVKDAPGIPQTVALKAKYAAFPDANVNVTVKRGLTSSVSIEM